MVSPSKAARAHRLQDVAADCSVIGHVTLPPTGGRTGARPQRLLCWCRLVRFDIPPGGFT